MRDADCECHRILRIRCPGVPPITISSEQRLRIRPSLTCTRGGGANVQTPDSESPATNTKCVSHSVVTDTTSRTCRASDSFTSTSYRRHLGRIMKMTLYEIGELYFTPIASHESQLTSRIRWLVQGVFRILGQNEQDAGTSCCPSCPILQPHVSILHVERGRSSIRSPQPSIRVRVDRYRSFVDWLKSRTSSSLPEWCSAPDCSTPYARSR